MTKIRNGVAADYTDGDADLFIIADLKVTNHEGMPENI